MISIPFKKGEIVLATIPYTDLRASKLRPALVVSAGQIGQDLTIAAI